MAELFGIPNIEYIGGGIGILIIFVLIWFALKGRSGRLGEERAEENETVQLLKDERVVEKDERDEKKQCAKMRKLFEEIVNILKEIEGGGEIYDRTMLVHNRISVMLNRLREEKMSLERAISTFKELHSSINEFLSYLPTKNKEINSLVQKINEHQKKYYADLVNEVNMDRDKKKQLKELWAQTLDEERGQGKLQSV